MSEKPKVANKFARAASIESGRGLVITLDYEARFLRRKRLLSDTGEPFLVDLAETVSLDHGDVFICDDGTEITLEPGDGIHIPKEVYHNPSVIGPRCSLSFSKE